MSDLRRAHQVPPARHRDEGGAVAILVSVSLTVLLVVTAMVLDFGLVRLDRQQVKLAADNAVMSGLRASDANTAQVYSYRGVCAALEFLRANDDSLRNLPDGACATPDNAAICNPTNPSAGAAVYTGSVQEGDVTSTVTIKLPYDLSDGDFPEESLSSLSGDSSTAGGCDQLGVIITQSRPPGLGSLATSSDLTLRQRSVGRVKVGDGDLAPALLLLERTECGVLTVGSAGSPSRIKVYGSNVTDIPGTIHSDSAATASDCGSGSNRQLFQGKQADGVVAYGSQEGSSGVITSVATLNGTSASVVRDAATQVYGTTARDESAVGGTGLDVQPRGLVGRLYADERYLAGVTDAVRAAYPRWVEASPPATGYTHTFGCPSTADMTTMAGLNATHSVYINCNGNSGITLNGTIGAGRIFFHGFIKSGNLRMPNATKVYVDNTSNSGARINADAITLGTGNGFCIGPSAVSGCSTLNDAGACAAGTSTTQADLIVRRGAITSGGTGLLRLCNTRVISAGGQLGNGTLTNPGGCLPTTNGTYLSDPASSTPPCPGASTPDGTGLVTLSGVTDWTAPNRYADMDALGLTDAEQEAAWFNGEDLALWTETYGDGPDFKMTGGGSMRVRGVFMVPHAEPFTISGGGTQDLTDAQFITRKFAVDGGATLSMRVDPYSSITLPDLDPFTLVR